MVGIQQGRLTPPASACWRTQAPSPGAQPTSSPGTRTRSSTTKAKVPAWTDVGALRGVGEQVEGVSAGEVGLGSHEADGLSRRHANRQGTSIQLARTLELPLLSQPRTDCLPT
jgi:hypothetical protein